MLYGLHPAPGLLDGLIVLCSVFVVGITLERVVTIACSRSRASLVDELEVHLRYGDLMAALGHAASCRGASARVALRILREGLAAPERADAARAEALVAEEALLSRRVAHVPRVAGLAALLGLLATTTGMCGGSCGGYDARSRAVSLALQLGEALHSHAGGLFVVVEALACFLVVRALVDTTVARLRADARRVTNLLTTHRPHLRIAEHRPASNALGYRVSA